MHWENVIFLDNIDREIKLRYKELLHIFKRKLELNKQLNSQSDHGVETLIIKTHPEFRIIKKE